MCGVGGEATRRIANPFTLVRIQYVAPKYVLVMELADIGGLNPPFS